jgi:prolyl-tRNA synthetase
MVIKPWGMGVWDLLRSELDTRIRDTGASNAYFPLFIPQSFLSKEAEHVDGFAKECAVVTHHRLCANPLNSKELIPDPDAKLEVSFLRSLLTSTLANLSAPHRKPFL